MEATLLSTLMLLVEELPVKTWEGLHGSALPLSDPLYGTFDKILAALRKRLRPDPREYFTPNWLVTCSASGFEYTKIAAAFCLHPTRRFGCDSSRPFRMVLT